MVEYKMKMIKLSVTKILAFLMLFNSSMAILKKGCVEKSLEGREEDANIVISATVKDLIPDARHPGMIMGDVEIKRVFKGDVLLNNYINPRKIKIRRRKMHRRVKVEGFRDPTICDSDIERSDTRIFLLNTNGDGNLKLNSSVLRVNMLNLDYTDAVVKDIPFIPPKAEPQSSCQNFFCAFYGECHFDTVTNKAACRCPLTSCPNDPASVCGGDGMTYNTPCHLRQSSCKKQRRIKVKHAGKCKGQEPIHGGWSEWENWSQCSVSCGAGKRRRFRDCSNPPPSANGLYCGDSWMQEEDCVIDCDPCQGFQCTYPETCMLDAKRRPTCQCNLRCPDEVNMVCGSNGHTYSNKCWLEREACRSKTIIDVYHRGRCKDNNPCKIMQCDFGEVCKIGKDSKARCQCPPACPPVVNKVCGTDDVTYENECELWRGACLNKTVVEVKHQGACGGAHCRIRCGYGARCVKQNGTEKCVCPHQCRNEYYEPVCGSDGKSYTNYCKLQEHNCLHKTNVRKEHEGLCNGCGKKQTCEHYSYCDHSGPRAKCVCPTYCEKTEDAEVCGSDGRTYKNECNLRVASCKHSTYIVVRLLGKCEEDPYNVMCKRRKCKFGEICQNDRCVCPTNCGNDGDIVCGSNGRTYRNKCEMMRDSCNQRRDLVLQHFGRCQTSVPCDQFKRCPDTVQWVCASNSLSYMNECKMKKEACRLGQELIIESFGECEDSWSGSGSGEGEEGSGDEEILLICEEDVNCRFGGKCVADGQHGYRCDCNKNCKAVRQTVCGSDGKTYGNLCQMEEESCNQQKEIIQIELENCNEMEELACDGYSPLVNPVTNLDYYCTKENVCPEKSYCHINFHKCCKEEFQSDIMENCKESKYGCCQDGINVAPGPSFHGCPSDCTCDQLGTRDNKCHPTTNKCNCKPGVGGAKCDSCIPGYWNMYSGKGCKLCNCNPRGSTRADCHQMSGKCLCKEGATGLKCDQCKNGLPVGINGCIEGAPIRGTCDELMCGFGGVCVERNNMAYCDCSSLPCLSTVHENTAVVCGSDGNTYTSECQLQRAACERQKTLHMHLLGPCDESVKKTTSPMSGGRHPRKTTKYDDDPNVTKSTERPTRGKKHPPQVKIKDICLHGNYCAASNSQCRQGICQCNHGYISSSDLTECVEVKTIQPDAEIDVDSCNNNPCRNHGICRLDKDLGFRCLCPIGISGPICKDNGRITTPSFSGMSQMILRKTIKTEHEITVDLYFKALNYDGLLLFNSQYSNGSGDFLSLSLRNGYVEFRFDVGGGPVTIRNREKIQLNHFIHVTASRDGRQGSLIVDKEMEVFGSAPGSLVSLNLDGPFYLGNAQGDISMHDQTGNSMGFVGCIKTFQVQNKLRTHLYDLSYPQLKDDIMSGLDIGECGSNSCNSLPCKYGGTCQMKGSDVYSCMCKKGFTGHDCDVVLDPCVMSNCHETSTCEQFKNSYRCICSPNREGHFCEFEKLQPVDIPEFSANSYLELPLGDIGSTAMTFTIWFKISQPNGVLFYASHYQGGNGDFISLTIVNRKIEFRFNMGSGTVVILSNNMISLNTWHEVMIDKTKKTGTLLIDRNPRYNYTGESKGFLTELNLVHGDKSILYIGGFKSRFDIPVDSNITQNLTGVIQRMYVNGKLYDDLMSAASVNVNVIPYKGPPCNVNPCLNGGICIPKKNDVECKCPAKFIGVKCEKRVDSVNRDRPLLFDGETYLQYSNEISEEVKAQRSNKYYIKFRTLKSNGLILYQNGKSSVLGDYLAVAIVRGKVEFSYNLGKQSENDIHIIRSTVDVNDGGWHYISIERHERIGTLHVDEEPPITSSSTEGASQLDTNGILLIGGKTRVNIGLPDDYNEGFAGCIQEVLINDQELHLVRHRRTGSAVNFCDSS